MTKLYYFKNSSQFVRPSDQVLNGVLLKKTIERSGLHSRQNAYKGERTEITKGNLNNYVKRFAI